MQPGRLLVLTVREPHTDRFLLIFMILILHLDRAGIISTEAGLRSGLTTAHVQRADKYGGGFFVNVEGMHHLHCLVSLIAHRTKHIYWNQPELTKYGANRTCFVNLSIITMITTRRSEHTPLRTTIELCAFMFVSLFLPFSWGLLFYLPTHVANLW
jgi:hypothetical protein